MIDDFQKKKTKLADRPNQTNQFTRKWLQQTATIVRGANKHNHKLMKKYIPTRGKQSFMR